MENNDDDSYSKRVNAEIQQLRRWHELKYLFERFFIRSIRIFFGIIIVLISVKGCESATELASIPFASLTIGKSFGFLGLAVLTIYGFYFAFYTAFGEGPSREAEEQILRQEAIQNIASQDSKRAMEVVLMRQPRQDKKLIIYSSAAGRYTGKILRRFFRR